MQNPGGKTATSRFAENESPSIDEILRSAPNSEPILTREPSNAAVQSGDAPWSIWSPKQRKLIILTASFASLLSPLSSQIYLPALDTIAKGLNVTNSQVNLSITTYLVLQAIAPTFTAQLSDTVGRRPLYMACFVLYMAANLGLALQNNYAALLVLRCFQSAGSSGTTALSNAVATDITTSAQRGSYIVYAAAIPMLGPTLGPIAGVPMAILFPETCREIVGDGSIPPQKWNRCYTNVHMERRLIKEGNDVPHNERDGLGGSRDAYSWIPNPFSTITLLLERECGFTLLYGSLLYGSLLCCSFYATLTLIPSQFHAIYGFNELQIALCFIPFGLGSLVAAFNRGRMLDSNFRRHATRLGITTDKNKQTDLTNFPIERARLEVALPTILLGSACMVGFGWTLHYKTNLAGPLILLFVIAFCLSASLHCATCLMLDLYPGKAGTVTASNNLLRCLLGAGAAAAVVPMINAIGTGWTLTIFASSISCLYHFCGML
ncbi:hypothetical protein FANTH_12809 [Fusarium anthophilum]|uniref:Major facilitator superfamily (MFS) profile domain-containing protein n=1 Tax=Fusarium anthophilum TaxID=48485 RepID=A0A8H4YR65_9HYPO|nr:hypothetical protein FANTH_12809 [Fusarium anthophilum]